MKACEEKAPGTPVLPPKPPDTTPKLLREAHAEEARTAKQSPAQTINLQND